MKKRRLYSIVRAASMLIPACFLTSCVEQRHKIIASDTLAAVVDIPIKGGMIVYTLLSPSYYFSTDVPSGIRILGSDISKTESKDKLDNRKIISVRGSRRYVFPENDESRCVFDKWWKTAQNMGSWNGFWGGFPRQDLVFYFSDGIYVVFSDDRIHYEATNYCNPEVEELFGSGEVYSRPLTEHDIKLREYLMRIVRNPEWELTKKEENLTGRKY